MIPFLAFPPEVRRVIYTTNAIEALNRQLRKAIKTKGHFPNEDAARKLIYLAIINAVPAWTNDPQLDRSAARVQDPLRRPTARLNPLTQKIGRPPELGPTSRNGVHRALRVLISCGLLPVAAWNVTLCARASSMSPPGRAWELVRAIMRTCHRLVQGSARSFPTERLHMSIRPASVVCRFTMRPTSGTPLHGSARWHSKMRVRGTERACVC